MLLWEQKQERDGWGGNAPVRPETGMVGVPGWWKVAEKRPLLKAATAAWGVGAERTERIGGEDTWAMDAHP